MLRSSLPALALVACAIAPAARAADPPLDTAAIESITGIAGTMNAAENVYKISKPRTDIKPSVDRWTLPPFMGITSYAAFMPIVGGTMVMGDTVLLEDEVNPAMSAALDAGLEVTALHNHFFFESPRVMYMHIGGTGNAATLAAGVKKVLDRVTSVRSAAPAPSGKFPGPAVPDTNSITASDLDTILGTKGESNNGMYKA